MNVGSGKSEVGRKGTAGRRSRTKSVRSEGAALGSNSYGKSRVRMMKVERRGKVHTVREFCVDIALRGDFDAVHCEGDNAHCLPTDTMKNTVYALGRKHAIVTIEGFAWLLGGHFVSRNPQVSCARVRIAEVAWERLVVKGKPHPHSFSRGSGERAVCEVTVERSGATVISGIDGLVLLKSTDSAFSGYPRDEFTTLRETRDRIFATSVTARWMFTDDPKGKLDHGACRENIRRALVETFATHKSESVQHTLYAMGEAALAGCPAIDRIRLSLPNKHCLLADLSPFGMDNPNEIFVPTDEPHGLIEATVERR